MRSAFIAILALVSTAGVAQDSASSVERGAHIAIIGGCHDCHTAGYGAANGKLDPAKALLGDALG